MVSVEGVWRKHKNTMKLTEILDEDGPMVLQLFGSNPESFQKATLALEHLDHITEININSGCPVKKVLKSGSGTALMKDPVLLGNIVNSVRKSTKKTVSVKMRSGFDFSSLNYVECAKVCEQEGADLVILHPRTAKMMFSGTANWEHIKILKSEVKIKVVGNGDILNIHDAERMMEQTGCDSVMVGRAVFGNPWFFKNEIKKLDVEFIKTLLCHVNLAVKFYGKERAHRLMKKHLIYYVKGLDVFGRDKRVFYDEIMKSQNVEEEIKIVENFIDG